MNLGLDLQRNQVVGSSIHAASVTTTQTGSGVNLGECEGPVTAVVLTGSMSTIGGLWDIKFQESKNDNTADAQGAADAYADISGATMTQISSNGGDNTMTLYTFFNRAEQYVRAVATASGSTSTTLMAVGLMSKSKSY